MLKFEEERTLQKPRKALRYTRRTVEGGNRETVATLRWAGHTAHLRFEGDRVQKQSRPKKSALKFTDAERAVDAKTPLPSNNNQAKDENSVKQQMKKKYSTSKENRRKFSSKTVTDLKHDASDAISKQADASENDAVRGADRERRIAGTGAKYGGRVGKWHRSGREGRLEKRENKKLAKGYRTKHQAEQYWQQTGRELPRAVRQQKRQMKRRQIRTFADAKLGKNKVDFSIKALTYVAEAAKKVLFNVISYLGFPLLGVVVVVALLFGMAAMMLSLMQSTAVTMLASYTSADADIEAASLLATELEAKLRQDVEGLPSAWEWGHIDEFRYDTDLIGHDPFELMAYLSVKYPGFDMGPLSPVPGEIRQLQEARYDLILEQQVETRYRTESSTDPVTGEVTEEEIPYDYYILNIILRSKGVEQAVYSELMASPEGELWEWYGVLMETCGARQEFANPFDSVDWRGHTSSLYGYRIDPVHGINLQIHRGLDIPMPEGTELLAGLTGRVLYIAHNDASFGNYVILESDSGVTMQYAHCQEILAVQGAEVTAGQTVIALVGNTGASTGSHVHIEIKKDGKYINPIFAIKYTGEDSHE